MDIMDNYFNNTDLYINEEQRLHREMRRQKNRERMMLRRRKAMILLGCYILGIIIVLFLLIFGTVKLVSHLRNKTNNPSAETQMSISNLEDNYQDMTNNSAADEPPADIEAEAAENTVKSYYAEANEKTTDLPGEVVSSYGILIDAGSNTIVAERNGYSRMNPASMTKVLTVLVASENVSNLDDVVTMDYDVLNYCYVHDLSAIGFAEGEEVTVRDLFYGTILKSAADCAIPLAIYAAGSKEAFVDLMNKKLEEIGVSETSHFTNCTGEFDENHYTTPYDMAMIMEAAMDNELCRQVMSEHVYTIKTNIHPEGLEISNWFLRRIEDHVSGGIVNYAKTGFVVQSGNCAVSSAVDDSNRTFICVTGNSSSSWKCIFDHKNIYMKYFNSI